MKYPIAIICLSPYSGGMEIDAIKLAKTENPGFVLVNLSGRGDKDMDFVLENYGDRL